LLGHEEEGAPADRAGGVLSTAQQRNPPEIAGKRGDAVVADGGNRGWTTVALLCCLSALIYSDQSLLAPNLTAVGESFGLSPRETDVLAGDISAAIWAVGAPSALAVGWLADRYSRRWLLCTVALLAQVPSGATILFVTKPWQLVALRGITGIAVGGSVPVMYSLLGDLFPVSKRANAVALVPVAQGAGLAGGQVVGALLGSFIGWRLPYAILAALVVVVAVVTVAVTSDPRRGSAEEALQGNDASGEEYQEHMSCSKLAPLLRTPTNLLMILQGLPGCLPWGLLVVYLNDFLVQNKGLSLEAATLVVLAFGAGCSLGVAAGGAGGQLCYNTRRELLPVVMGAAMMLSPLPLLALINMPLENANVVVPSLLGALGGFLASIPVPNSRTIVLNVNRPEARGVAMALQAMLDDLGKGLGPSLVSLLIVQMGRQRAFNLALLAWIPTGLMLLAACLTLRRDEDRMQASLLEWIHHHHEQTGPV